MLNSILQQGMFQVDPNATPEDLERRRQRVQQMFANGGQSQSVLEGAVKLAGGAFHGLKNRNAREFEGEKRAEASNLFEQIMGASAGRSGPTSPLLGSAPQGAPVPTVTTGPIPDTPESVGADTRAALGLPENDTATRLKAGLLQRGLPEYVADGFLMNWRDESGLNSGINEIEPLVPGSRGGFGLSQWTGPRRRELEQFAAARGVPVDDEDMQLDFLMHELNGSESRAADVIFSTRDAPSAAAAIVNDFLRPAETHRASREARYLGGAASPSDGTAPTQSSNMQDLMAAMANPWMTPEQKAIIGGQISQMQQANDPLRQLQIQQAQIDLERARNPQPEPMYRDLSPEEAAGLGLTDGTYQQAPDGRIVKVGGGGVNVTVGGQGEVGAIPQGYELFTDPETNERAMRPIPGGPEDNSGDAVTAIEKAESGIALIDSVMNDPALPSITGMVQGRLAPMTQAGTDLNVKIDQLQGQAFLAAFESLKGGGQITQIEGDKATQAMARLNRAQSTGAYQEALAEMQYIMTRARDRAKGLDVGSYDFSFNGVPQATNMNDATPDADGWTTLPNGVRVREVN